MADRQNYTYCKNIMDHCEHLTREEKLKYKGDKRCKHCTETASNKQFLEAHLFHAHQIYTTEGNFIWGDSILERYFTREHKYIAKCNECGSVHRVYSKSKLLEHLELHPGILDTIQNEITSSWLKDQFRIDTVLRKAHCIYQCSSYKIFNGINFFEKHLAVRHGISKPSEFGGGTRSYNVDATIQQPVAEGSYASTSSRHRHRQGDQQRSAPSTSTSMSGDNLHGAIQHRSETETIKQKTRPEPQTGIASGSNNELEDENLEMYKPDVGEDFGEIDLSVLLQSFESKDALLQITSAPSTSALMSDDNLPEVIQHRSETETIKQIIRSEQQTGTATDFNAEECAELFETLQSESETADLLDQTKLFESKDASSQIKPVPCSAKSVDDENVKNLPESKTRKRKSDPTDEDVKSETRKRESDPTDEDVKNLPESKTRKRKSDPTDEDVKSKTGKRESDPTKQSPEEELIIDLEYKFKATDVRQSSSEDSE